MITKFTIARGGTTSYIHDDYFATRRPAQAVKDAREDSERLYKIGQLISFLLEYPEHNVRAAIGAHFGADRSIDVRHKTKKYRIYWIPGLYIHEEDQKT